MRRLSTLASAVRKPHPLAAVVARYKISKETVHQQRFYRIEGMGEPLPSVTTVLSVVSKPAVAAWERKVTADAVKRTLLGELQRSSEWLAGASPQTREQWLERVLEQAAGHSDASRDQAADFGSAAHAAVEAHLRGERVADPRMGPVLAGLERLVRDARLELDVPSCEAPVWSARHRYAGSLDAVAWRGSRLLVLDWKTSRVLRPEYALQVAAYARAVEELTQTRVDEAWVVRLARDRPEYEVRRVRNLDAAFQLFLQALQLWRLFHAPPSPTTPSLWDRPDGLPG